jgi:hypothetical protein
MQHLIQNVLINQNRRKKVNDKANKLGFEAVNQLFSKILIVIRISCQNRIGSKVADYRYVIAK